MRESAGMRTPTVLRMLGGGVLLALLLAALPSSLHAADGPPLAPPPFGTPRSEVFPFADSPSEALTDGQWLWPVSGPRVVVNPFRAPAQPWSAGHRGIDVALLSGTTIRAPAPGVVAFRGTVADRPLITISHAGGLVTTLEPVLSTLNPGDPVTTGTDVGTLAVGGHSAPGALHVGVRWHGAYINPLLLFGGVPRAVLLPCCE